MKKFTMNFAKDLHKRLKHYSVEHDIDMATIIQRLVKEFLDKEEKKKK